jgi:hypothetical protein
MIREKEARGASTHPALDMPISSGGFDMQQCMCIALSPYQLETRQIAWGRSLIPYQQGQKQKTDVQSIQWVPRSQERYRTRTVAFVDHYLSPREISWLR